MKNAVSDLTDLTKSNDDTTGPRRSQKSQENYYHNQSLETYYIFYDYAAGWNTRRKENADLCTPFFVNIEAIKISQMSMIKS